jgi:GNAT superfamily N-acetyltransferase
VPVSALHAHADWVQQPPAEYHALGADWKSTRGIFKELHTRFHGTQEAPFMPNEALHCLYFTCVRPSARGQGVMKGLWSQTIDAAKDNNYSSVIAEAGSEPVTQVLTEYLGFREVSAVDYASHEHEGKKVYAQLPQSSATAYRALRLLKRRVNSDLYV